MSTEYQKHVKVVGTREAVHEVASFFRNSKLGYQKSLRKSSGKRRYHGELKPIYTLSVWVNNENNVKLENYLKLKNDNNIKVFVNDLKRYLYVP